MLKSLFPDVGWYLYKSIAIADGIQIKGPYTKAYAERLCLNYRRSGVHGVSLHSVYHWTRPEGAISPTEEEINDMGWNGEMEILKNEEKI